MLHLKVQKDQKKKNIIENQVKIHQKVIKANPVQVQILFSKKIINQNNQLRKAI